MKEVLLKGIYCLLALGWQSFIGRIDEKLKKEMFAWIESQLSQTLLIIGSEVKGEKV